MRLFAPLIGKHPMDINELKKLLKKSTAVLVLDSGDPSFVILDYETYKDLILKEKGGEKEIKINNGGQIANGNGKSAVSAVDLPRKTKEEEMEILERINKDILVIKNEIENEEKMASLDPALEKHW